MYLGFRCTLSGANTTDRTARLQQAHIGFYTLRDFWHVAPFRLVRVAFRAVVFSPMVSGWAVVCPLQSDVQSMQARLVAYACSSLH